MSGMDGLRVLVTGGASGIGAATAARFEEEGARVVVLDRERAEGFTSVVADLSDDASVRAAVAEAVETLAPLSSHLHLVDGTGVDGEGVQVGEGDVDWPVLAEQLDRLAPGVSFIPEIWQGHVNDGEGFWIALERLEQWF